MSALLYSGASAWLPAKRRCTRLVSASALRNNGSIHGCCDTAVHPASASAPTLAAPRRMTLRRVAPSPMVASHLAFDLIPAGDHRADVVPRPRQYDHHDMHDEESEKRKRAY